MADWSALPYLAVLAIADRLPFSIDYVRFRSVCSSWRSAAPRRLHLPWLALHRLDNAFLPVFSFSTSSAPNLALHPLPLTPAALQSPCCGASNGWLALIERPHNISLFNPITGARIHIPPLPLLSNDRYSDDFYRVVLSADPAATHNFVALLIRGGWESLHFCRPGDDVWPLIKHPEIIGCIADAQFYCGRFYVACGRAYRICL